MTRTALGRAGALTVFVGTVGALVFQACSTSVPPPPTPTASPEPPATASAEPLAVVGSPGEPVANAAPSGSGALPEPASVAPPPGYMGASKSGFVFHPHSAESPSPAPQTPPVNEGATKKNAAP